MKKRITLAKTRSVLYLAGRVLGDINAIKKGRIGQRIANRIVGKVSGRIIGKGTRSIGKLIKKNK